MGDNRPRLYAAMCAAHWLGAVAVPFYQDATADEMASPVQSAEITHVFAENQEQVDKLLEILPRCPTVRSIVYDKDRGMRHYKRPELVSYDALLQQGRELAAAKSSFLQDEAARGTGQDAAFLFFTSGTTGPAKGVVLTHGALIDRARVAATIGESEGHRRRHGLPAAGLDRPESFRLRPADGRRLLRLLSRISDTMLADMREMGPTYFLATPRVLEALLTQVSMRMEEAGGFNQRLYRSCMAVAHRIDGRRDGLPERSPGRGGVRLLICGPFRDVLGMSNVRVAYTAGDAVAPALVMFFRALGINLKQLYGSTETGFFVAMQRDGAGQAGHGRTGGRRRRTEIDASSAKSWCAHPACSGNITAIRKRRRRQRMPKAGFTPATPAISAMTGNCGSSTA